MSSLAQQQMKMDIAFTFDMTRSMTPCIYQVRQELNRFLISIKKQIDDVRIGIITHGDYDSSRYVTRHMNFTSDMEGIKSYISTVEDAGDNYWNEGEAYEQALRVANELDWRPDAKKILIVIGDDIPHPPFFEGKNKKGNNAKTDWRTELEKLNNNEIFTYGVNAPTLSTSRSEFFYSELSKKALNGNIIPLNQFIYIVDILLALIYSQSGNEAVESLETELISSNRYNRNMEVVMNTLLNRTDENRTGGIVQSTSNGNNSLSANNQLETVNPSRFQVLSVPTDISIKGFVISTGADFQVGKGFYELTKKEIINKKKEVILQHATSGNFYTGIEARNLLNLNDNFDTTITTSNIPQGYNAFIQSTSYNRKLIGNTKFLYEMTQ
jgi:hypothetical protein